MLLKQNEAVCQLRQGASQRAAVRGAGGLGFGKTTRNFLSFETIPINHGNTAIVCHKKHQSESNSE